MEQLIDKWNPNNETDKEFQVQGSKPIFLINIFLMPSSELMAVRSKLLILHILQPFFSRSIFLRVWSSSRI